jgi:hypothetical protein
VYGGKSKTVGQGFLGPEFELHNARKMPIEIIELEGEG